jgi:hypothetical protein
LSSFCKYIFNKSSRILSKSFWTKNKGNLFLSFIGDKLNEKNIDDFSKLLFSILNDIWESKPLK